MSFVNGYSEPRFVVRLQSNNSLVDTIDLDLTAEDGLIERYTPEMDIVHVLLSGEKTKRPKGYRITFELDYSFSNRANTFKIASLLNYASAVTGNEATYKFILFPRVDVLSRFYEVIYIGEPVDLGIMKGGANAPGNKLIRIAFETVNLQNQVGWLNPDDLTVPLLNNYCNVS